MARSLRIEIRPRLHMGLLSMHSGGYRKNGGIGFAVEEPTTVLEVCSSQTFRLTDERQNPLTNAERAVIGRLVDDAVRAERFGHSVSTRLLGVARPHVGLGMGTGVRLAILEGLYLLNGAVGDQEALVQLSERGGTSGIGIRTYFQGGLVVDLGVRNLDHNFLPSSTSGRKSPPPILARAKMPDWPVCLCLPLALRPRTQAEERDFFRTAAPVDKHRAYEATYHAVFGAFAAVEENDRESFCTAIDALQKVEWKLREREQYGKELLEVESNLRAYGMTSVGMSSLGPLLYGFGPKTAILTAKEKQEEDGCMIFVTSPANCRRSILEVHT